MHMEWYFSMPSNDVRAASPTWTSGLSDVNSDLFDTIKWLLYAQSDLNDVYEKRRSVRQVLSSLSSSKG